MKKETQNSILDDKASFLPSSLPFLARDIRAISVCSSNAHTPTASRPASRLPFRRSCKEWYVFVERMCERGVFLFNNFEATEELSLLICKRTCRMSEHMFDCCGDRGGLIQEFKRALYTPWTGREKPCQSIRILEYISCGIVYSIFLDCRMEYEC
jgi:hypothetical protein